MIKFKFEVDQRKIDPAKYCDVTLTTKDAEDCQEIRAHKVILAALSPKLATLFNEATDKCVYPLIVRNIKFSTLYLIISFLYTGKVSLADKTSDVIEDLRDGFDMLKIDLSEKIVKKLSEELKSVRKIELRRQQLKTEKGELKDANHVDLTNSLREDFIENRKPKSDNILQPDQIKKESGKRKRDSTQSLPVLSPRPGQDNFDLRKVIKKRKEVGDMVRKLRNASQDSSSIKTMVNNIPVHVRPHYELDYNDAAVSVRESSDFRGGSVVHPPVITYHFEPNRPQPDPNHPTHLQAMLGPLPLDMDYYSLNKAVTYLGSVRKLFLQYTKDTYLKDKFQTKVKWAYVVFNEEHVVQKLLVKGFIKVGKNFFKVASMGCSRARSRSHDH